MSDISTDTLQDPEWFILSNALDALQEKTGIKGTIDEDENAARDNWDLAVYIRVNGKKYHYFVECKSFVDRKMQINTVQRRLASTDKPVFLAAPYISKELAEYCREVGLQFVDAQGNAYLRNSDLFVFITGEKGERHHHSTRTSKGLTNSAGLRIAFALLSKPELLNSTFKNMASQAGVAMGTAYNGIDDLESRGYLINKADSERRKLLEPQRLLEEWAINYPTTLRTKLQSRRFSSPDPFWWKKANLEGLGAVWGGEVAAEKLTAYLKPSTQTLYAELNEMSYLLNTLVKEHRLRPDPNGNIEILEKFWHFKPKSRPTIAPPVLIYADLLALMDPRAQETANLIKEKFIEPTFDKG